MLTQNVVIDQSGNLAVAKVTTPLLSATEGHEIIAALQERMRYSNASQFILDLHEVEFMDSGFIGTLVSFLQDVQQMRGKIIIAAAQPNVAFLFKVTRLDKVFALCDSVELAVKEMQS